MYGAVPLRELKRQLPGLRAADKLDRVKVIMLTNRTCDGVVYDVERVPLGHRRNPDRGDPAGHRRRRTPGVMTCPGRPRGCAGTLRCSFQDVHRPGDHQRGGDQGHGRLQHHRQLRPLGHRHGIGGLNAVALVNDTYP